jgi:hypothetical protein
MSDDPSVFFFKCSVSEDLYGASPNANGSPLPTPGGGNWVPIDGLQGLGSARTGFNREAAMADISKWGCHWFTSNGPTDIIWGEEGPPAGAEEVA